MSDHFENRKNRLVALAIKFLIPTYEELAHCNSSSAEDMWEYLHGDEPIGRWAAVTHSGGSGDLHYVKTFGTREQAERRTIEYVSDDIFAETPVAVVDLDATDAPWGRLYPLIKLIPEYEVEPGTTAEKEAYLKEHANLVWNIGTILEDRVEPGERERALVWEYLYENMDDVYEPVAKVIDSIEVAVFG